MVAHVQILAEKINGTSYAAVISERRLIDLYTDAEKPHPVWGDIYYAKVVSVHAKQDLAYLDLGKDKQGIIHGRHVRLSQMQKNDHKMNIGQLLKPGQMLLVQVKSEEKPATALEEMKHAACTMKIYLAGRYLIYTPVANTVTVSRKIENAEILKAAQELDGDGGWIIRSCANQANSALLHKEARRLQHIWERIQEYKDKAEDKASIIFAGRTAIERALLDYSDHTEVTHIETVGDNLYQQADKWCAAYASDWQKHIHAYPEAEGLFEHHDLLDQIDILSERQIDLPSGGSLVLDHTHAMTVIDVNSNACPNIVTTNMEAAHEISRQIKLRNLSGIIIVDFINMRLKTDRLRIASQLEKDLEHDPAAPIVHGFTRLGLVELTRKRRSAPFHEKS